MQSFHVPDALFTSTNIRNHLRIRAAMWGWRRRRESVIKMAAPWGKRGLMCGWGASRSGLKEMLKKLIGFLRTRSRFGILYTS